MPAAPEVTDAVSIATAHHRDIDATAQTFPAGSAVP
jgi:hypothetical protein